MDNFRQVWFPEGRLIGGDTGSISLNCNPGTSPMPLLSWFQSYSVSEVLRLNSSLWIFMGSSYCRFTVGSKAQPKTAGGLATGFVEKHIQRCGVRHGYCGASQAMSLSWGRSSLNAGGRGNPAAILMDVVVPVRCRRDRYNRRYYFMVHLSIYQLIINLYINIIYIYNIIYNGILFIYNNLYYML